MSFSCAYYWCSCREQHSSVVGHCFWFVQNCGENGWWPVGCQWRRHDERHSSREEDEWPRIDGGDDQDDEWPRIDGGGYQDYEWPRFDGSDDRDDDRLAMGWDGEPLYENYIGTPMKLISYWEECCERCNVVQPMASDTVPRGSARGVRRNRRDFVDDEKYEPDSGEVMLRVNLRKSPDFVDDEKYESDGGEVMPRANLRKSPDFVDDEKYESDGGAVMLRANLRKSPDFVDDEKYESDEGAVMPRANLRKSPSVRRQRKRLVRGEDWF